MPDMGVGVAHTTGHDAHDDFTGGRVVEVELSDHDRLTCREQHRRARSSRTHAGRSSKCPPMRFLGAQSWIVVGSHPSQTQQLPAMDANLAQRGNTHVVRQPQVLTLADVDPIAT